MLKLTMSQLKQRLPLYLKADKPVMVWGGAGEGKSGVIRAVAQDTKHDLQDYRLLMREAVDVHGLPKDNGNGRMTWIYPEEIPLASDVIEKPRIMFLDELPAAPTSVQTVAYQMLHERAIDNKPLHKNIRFVAAGNRERDGAVSNRMPSPLANRFAHIEVEADAPSWIQWAAGAGVHPFIISYIDTKPASLRVESEKDYTSKAFRSPRTWEYGSDVLNVLAEGVDKTKIDLAVAHDVIASFVGDKTAADWYAHAKLGENLPDVKEVLEGKAKKAKLKLHEQFFLSSCFLSHLSEFRGFLQNQKDLKEYQKNEKFSSYVDNCFTYVGETFDTETKYAFLTRFVQVSYYGFKPNFDSAIQKGFINSLAGKGVDRDIFSSNF